MKVAIASSGIVLIISLILVKYNSSKNNVCKTFTDYYTNRDLNENCYYNPDGELTTPEIIKRWGYPLETHTVLTEDGYILTLFRILRDNKYSSKESKQPVLIQHGYKTNSKAFVAIGKKSLGFILADNRYDVWLGNFRGTTYSRNHSRIDDTQEAFWDFSFHEMGVYDTAAQIEYINKMTNKKVIYIGFSMGATVGTIYATTYPETAENKVKFFIMLAPLIFADGMGTHSRLGLKLWPYMAPIGQVLTGGQFYPEPYSDINKAMWKFFCCPYPIQMLICTVFDMLIFGIDYEQVDPETFPVTVLPLVDTVSIKTVSHISQFVTSEKFQHFDYGVEGNLKRYGSTDPPLYDLSKMRVLTYIMRSDNDLMSGKEGIEKFHSSLPERVNPYDVFVVKHDKFNHIDFILAKDVVSLLYDHIVEFMNTL